MNGKIKICCPTNFAILILSPIIATFQKKHPTIKFEVILNDARAMAMDDDYDLVIRAGTIPDKNIIAKKLIDWSWSVCASKEYLDKFGVPVTPNELSLHNCLDYTYRQDGRTWIFYHDGEEFCIKTSGTIESNNALFIKQVAVNGAGIVFLPRFMVKHEIANNLLVPILENYTAMKIPMYIMFSQNKSLPQKIRVFLDFISNELKLMNDNS